MAWPTNKPVYKAPDPPKQKHDRCPAIFCREEFIDLMVDGKTYKLSSFPSKLEVHTDEDGFPMLKCEYRIEGSRDPF